MRSGLTKIFESCLQHEISHQREDEKDCIPRNHRFETTCGIDKNGCS